MNPLPRFPARALAAVAFGVAFAASPPASAQGKDDQWEISSKVEMPGMPMAMPAQVVKICVGKNGKDEDFVPKQNNCRMVDSKRTGNKFTYRMECGGNDPSTMDGEVNFGTGAYDGKMKMTMTKSKESMLMTYSGKRTGDCTAPAK